MREIVPISSRKKYKGVSSNQLCLSISLLPLDLVATAPPPYRVPPLLPPLVLRCWCHRPPSSPTSLGKVCPQHLVSRVLVRYAITASVDPNFYATISEAVSNLTTFWVVFKKFCIEVYNFMVTYTEESSEAFMTINNNLDKITANLGVLPANNNDKPDNANDDIDDDMVDTDKDMTTKIVLALAVSHPHGVP
jgi:hypothetical protein